MKELTKQEREAREFTRPFGSKSNTTTDKKHTSEKRQSVYKRKAEYPKVVEALCLEFLVEVLGL